ncbi:4Fe-4S dicluster domain-containing protein [Candidatus Zixiibacteriota bacterium]
MTEHNETGKRGFGRRSFFKLLGAAGVATVPVGTAAAVEVTEHTDTLGVLIDTTRCMGCRTCEFMCAESNGLPEPDPDWGVLEEPRTTSDCQLTVVNQYETEKGPVFIKRQCMHCVQPACASACLTKAMFRSDEGPVIWREPKCMGCRFCMISCPFDMPKFEYDSPVPHIRKCTLCVERREQGEMPACVENCPGGALQFGLRSDLLREANTRIYNNPDDYNHEIYGEHMVGGTSMLYLASVPFEQLGLRTDLGTTPYPELTKGFLYSVPVVLTLVPAFLAAVSAATKSNSDSEGKGAHDAGK